MWLALSKEWGGDLAWSAFLVDKVLRYICSLCLLYSYRSIFWYCVIKKKLKQLAKKSCQVADTLHMPVRGIPHLVSCVKYFVIGTSYWRSFQLSDLYGVAVLVWCVHCLHYGSFRLGTMFGAITWKADAFQL